MTPKELLIEEIEHVPDTVIEELLDFLLISKMKHHRQQSQEQSFAGFIETLVSDIPSETINSLPADSAAEHDHYIYGSPKKETR